MGKKKPSATASDALAAHAAANGAKPLSNGKKAAPDAVPPSLTICRNKHWRFISAFHGPWLQLPHEILETLAHSNYLSPRPRQTDPGVLFDLLKVRRLVDEAADLAVRAQNGTASSALNLDHGLPGAALGLNTRGGANAKLSPERKYRMREVATQKLSQAYRLDEIAASVATMQSASALDSVASLVLQRAPTNPDAKYVHFFHEKIPSRMMAEYTSLNPLNDIISFEPGHAAPLRTRALTKIFKEDFHGAAQDLTEALSLCRGEQAKHLEGKNQLVSMKQAREEAERRRIWSRDWMHDNRVADDDQPQGMEMQLQFQRGNQYLTIACQHIKTALESLARLESMRSGGDSSAAMFQNPTEALACMTSAEQELFRRGLEAREGVRKYAKRALRDYTSYFSHLDYAFASTSAASDRVFDRNGILDRASDENVVAGDTAAQSHALARRAVHRPQEDPWRHAQDRHDAGLEVYTISELLSTSPPSDLPPFPASTRSGLATNEGDQNPHHHYHEMITHHPLLHETLHSLLLAHTLLQTPPTALHRIANNVARLARLADGYPFFLSARSPARADWSEILRKTRNWIGLSGTWDQLCKTSGSSGKPSRANGRPSTGAKPGDVVSQTAKVHEHGSDGHTSETEGQRKDRIHKEAVLDALGDERVVDDESFRKAVKAREKRAWRDLDIDAALTENSHTSSEQNISPVERPVDTADGDGEVSKAIGDAHSRMNGEPDGHATPPAHAIARDEEYLIGTERAEAISRWIFEAPTVVGSMDGTKPRRKKKPARKRAGDASGLENSVESLSMQDLE